MWGNWNPCALWVGMQTGAATVENSVEVPLNIKTRITIWSRNCTSGYLPKRIESSISKRHLCTHVHSNVIYNSQKVEVAKMAIYRWAGKQNVVYLYVCYVRIIEYFSALEGNSDTRYTMDKPPGYYAKWNKPLTKRQILYDSTYVRYLE